MKQVIVTRISDDGKETLGSLSFKQDNGSIFLCKTLELPWKNNASKISCIPAGSYTCVYSKSPHFSLKAEHDVFTYEITNVVNRAGIHSANFFSDLLGCIALGSVYSDINGDGVLDIIDSRNTIKAFEQQLNKQPFTLLIHPIVKV